MRRHRALLLVVPMLLSLPAVTGCATERTGTTPRPATESMAAETPAADVIADPTVDGRVAVGPHRLFIRCFGHGTPTIVLDAGDDSAGLDVFPASFIRPLAEQAMTCVYDREGNGRSDPPSAKRRTIDDLVSDLHGLLAAAQVPEPYLLVGSSGGGLVDVHYAKVHPDQVAGLVLLDSGVPNAHLDREFPGAQGWRNPEHVDWVDAERRLATLRMPIGDFPVLIVQADPGGEDETTDQSYWLALSPRARLRVMPGGHDLYQETPDAVASAVLATIKAG
jgi:pimeloyl-ACP methyl ester carboxylesterase